MWALVKWVGGEDDKKMTPGIDTKHIKNFDLKEFFSENHDPKRIYVVEWHDSKKMPLGGWKCFHAMVIEISRSITILERKVDALEGVRSPRFSIEKNLSSNSSLVDQDIEIVEKNNNTNEADNTNDNARKELRFSNTNMSSGMKPFEEQIEVVENDDTTGKEHQPLKNPSDSENFSKTSENQDSENVRRGEEPTASHEFVTKRDFDKAMLNIQTLLESYSESARSSSEMENRSERCKRSEPVKKSKIHKRKELGHEGSNVFITQDQWLAARSKNTFTAMTTSLVTSTFAPEVLLKSNYKGGKSKNTDDKKYKALDSRIINAIKETVKKHHDDFKEGPFGTAINNKCGKLRSEQKRREKEKD